MPSVVTSGSFRKEINMRKVLAPLIVLILGASIGGFLIVSKPQPVVVKPEKKLIKVATDSFAPGNYPALYHATGIVKSSQHLNLTSSLNGTVNFISPDFIPGHIVKKGEVLVKLGDGGLKRRLKISEANYNQAQAAYEVELGKQKVAKENMEVVFKATGEKPTKDDLILRKPQLQHALSDLSKAKQVLDTAKADLADSVIKSPFDAMILTKNIAIASNVTSHKTVLGDLVGVDQYWIELLVPDNVVPWITPKEKEITASVTTDYNSTPVNGYVLKTILALNESSRMARVIVAVDDPLQLKKIQSWQDSDGLQEHPVSLMLNDYVNVEVTGRNLTNVVKLPIDYLRSDNTVWLFVNGKLKINPVVILYKDNNFVYIKSGITAIDQVITTNIGMPVNNMHIENISSSGDLDDK